MFARVIYYIVLTITRVIYDLFWWPRLRGREHLPKGGCLICANHRSWFDPPLVAILLFDRPIGFLAKAELFGNPFFGWLIRTINAQPIRRGGIDRAAVRGVMEKLQRGLPVLVFPEGTRSRTGRMLPPRAGVGMLARQAGVPVVPTCIDGSFRINRNVFRWGHLRLRFGPAISSEIVTAYPDNKQGYRDLSAHIMRAICDLTDDPNRAWEESQSADESSQVGNDP